MSAAEEIDGEVRHVVFANPDSGFGVVELGDGSRAAGPLDGLVPGQPVRLVGRWTQHPTHGRTFTVDWYAPRPPRTPEALRALLSSEAFPGVGDVLAARLVDAFGIDLPAVLEDEPQRLVAVRGVSADLARKIAAAWAQIGALADLVLRLGEVGLGPGVARAALRAFGEDAVAVVDRDPYQLLMLPGVRWRDVDALGRRAGIAADDERRLRAAAGAAVRAGTTPHGHTYLPAAAAAADAARLLRAEEPVGTGALDRAAAAGLVVIDDTPLGTLPTPRAAPPALHHAERTLAADLARLVAAPPRLARVDAGGDTGLTRRQADAVVLALSTTATVLTGGPGTGKTRAVCEVVAAASAGEALIALCAPTGRAARRLEEVTGHRAGTVHRLLEARPEPGSGFTFTRGPDHPLPHDLVVVDEASMLDAPLAAALVGAVPEGAHLLLVGDVDQLPPVGPGAPLRDLIASGTVPVTHLDVVHRQAAASRIVTLAHEINAGHAVVPTGRARDGDVFCIPEQADRVADRVAAIVAERAPDFYGCAPSDVQVLAPMYRGPAGVDAINAACKQRLNPAAGRRPVASFHEGDRVVATRNNPELDVANGDVGEVAVTDPRERTLEVAFPQGMVTMTAEQAGDLAPAWCLTVHKAQGGEWPVVVVVLDPAHHRMLTRDLVYTAVTRAQRGLLLVGVPDLLAAAARRAGSGLHGRRTTLAARLVTAVP